MNLYDLILTLDSQWNICKIYWENKHFEKMRHNLFSNVLNSRLTDFFPISPGEISGEFVWKKENYIYAIHSADHGEQYFYLKKKDNSQYLLSKALNHIREGIQIYDENACAVFFNESSRSISQIPEGVDVHGRHLLDLYDLDENISTIMTCLKTHSPVINRVDHYETNEGTFIATNNCAYPITRNKSLVGSVVFEQTRDITDLQLQTSKDIQKALDSFTSHTKSTRFTGYTFDNIIGQGAKLQDAVALARKIAPQQSNILLVGETGTGKEVFAQSIHRESRRRHMKFIAINCAAIPDTLIESLLFGTEKGSFTGSENKAGYFEEANGGTLFLDELNSMSLHMQSKILRVLQENTFRRVGGQKDLQTDIRIISSCNEDPFLSISENRMRKDLFYRLSTVMIDLPSLWEHIEDLEELIRYHLHATSYKYVNPLKEVHPDAMQVMKEYIWPGNVRELFHVLDYAQNIADENMLTTDLLPKYIFKESALPRASASTSQTAEIDFGTQTLQSLMDSYENQVMIQALEHYGYNISKTADALGIRRQSLQYRIKKYGIIF